MSDKSLVDERGEPMKDPVDQFMRQLASSAAKHRRTVTGAPPVIVENALATKNEPARMPEIWKTEERLAPGIESVSVAEAEEVVRGAGSSTRAIATAHSFARFSTARTQNSARANTPAGNTEPSVSAMAFSAPWLQIIESELRVGAEQTSLASPTNQGRLRRRSRKEGF